MAHQFHLEYEVPGMDWDEMTGVTFTKSHWRRIKAHIRWCKRNKLRYEITRFRKP